MRDVLFLEEWEWINNLEVEFFYFEYILYLC